MRCSLYLLLNLRVEEVEPLIDNVDKIDLPATAIVKELHLLSKTFGKLPIGPGFRFPLFGFLSITAANKEGLEVNIKGLSSGPDLFDLALKIAGLGRLCECGN